MSKSTTTLDPRVRRTRKLLKSAFMEIIQEKGFEMMTVQDITDRADINRATFYAHYTDKFDLHDHMLLEWFQQTLTTYNIDDTTAFCGNNLRQLIFAVCDFVSKLNGGCHPMDIQYKPAIEDLIQNQIYNIVFSWLQSVDELSKPDISAAAVSWSIFGAAMQWSRQSINSKDEVADTVIKLIDSGLRTECNQLPDLAMR